MSNISYSSDELTHLFSDWETIMVMWDDNKSHTINDNDFRAIHQKCNRLVEVSESIHTLIMQIESESNSIY